VLLRLEEMPRYDFGQEALNFGSSFQAKSQSVGTVEIVLAVWWEGLTSSLVSSAFRAENAEVQTHRGAESVGLMPGCPWRDCSVIVFRFFLGGT
jgi:hypothetical protein